MLTNTVLCVIEGFSQFWAQTGPKPNISKKHPTNTDSNWQKLGEEV